MLPEILSCITHASSFAIHDNGQALKFINYSVPSIEHFMTRYRMDNPAALHCIRVAVTATVEHSSEVGPETGKWIAETT
ncbi:hypothetical protein DEU56DRAFT_795365 [Suillus clintonianus]|uniref:uncharacterized protein n=1 Tax=Suillus clintonianus TaxID=1904413 RepID=UPI001B878809|nr:uncharacterized protein DEU56DRAFT_795365 [Suillus clintonianus]KAG2141888.1 hypothetical protein DEU56DRAFT_795365 [Suillus clintonianus]